MAYQGQIIIPTEHDSAFQVVDHVVQRGADLFGGYSQYRGTGGWSDGEHTVEEEHERLVFVFEQSADYRTEDDYRAWLREQAEYVKDMLDQDAVLIKFREIDRELI